MKIIFVYNAESGSINTLLDIGHKFLRPDTYSCSLCSLTHGVLREKEAWQQYRAATEHELEFLHKDEFEEKYGKRAGQTYPVILRSSASEDLNEDLNKALEVLLATEEINALADLEELMRRLPSGGE
ncbi:MAG: GTPase [Candidatus Electrothrix sp. AUS3]|nr:GTPase [Candidatus Electrothrix gigas]